VARCEPARRGRGLMPTWNEKRPALTTPAIPVSSCHRNTIHKNRTPDPACILACSVHSCPWSTYPRPIAHPARLPALRIAESALSNELSKASCTSICRRWICARDAGVQRCAHAGHAASAADPPRPCLAEVHRVSRRPVGRRQRRSTCHRARQRGRPSTVAARCRPGTRSTRRRPHVRRPMRTGAGDLQHAPPPVMLDTTPTAPT
jgi:hypothetical protein